MLSRDAFTPQVTTDGPQADEDGHGVHQPVPAQRKRTELQDDQGDIDVDVKPSPLPSHIVGEDEKLSQRAFIPAPN